MAKNNKTSFFYVLDSDKRWVSDQPERTQGPTYIRICNNVCVVVTRDHVPLEWCNTSHVFLLEYFST